MACVITIPTGVDWTRVVYNGNRMAMAKPEVVSVQEIPTCRRLRDVPYRMCNWVSLSPCAPLLATTRIGSSEVHVWDLTANTQATVLRGHTNSVLFTVFSPDGRLLASTSLDRTIRLWRTDDWTDIVLVGHNNGFSSSVEFSQDNRWLVARLGEAVGLWRISPNLEVTPAGSMDAPRYVNQVAVHPEGQALAFCTFKEEVNDNPIRIVDVVNNMVGGVRHKLHGHTEPVYSLVFSPCGRRLASGSDDVRLWDVATGACVRVLQRHMNNVLRVLRIVYVSQGKQLVTTTVGGTIRVWTVCPWNDHTNRLFGQDLKRRVFALMCVRARLPSKLFLPMEVWLMVMEHLSKCLRPNECGLY